jgi:hypothetical protein
MDMHRIAGLLMDLRSASIVLAVAIVVPLPLPLPLPLLLLLFLLRLLGFALAFDSDLPGSLP